LNAQRRPLIAGNWKMNHGGRSGVELAIAVTKLAPGVPHVDLVIAPPFTALAACAHECDGKRVEISAQNLHPKDSGAFTGEVSAPMLLESGCKWVIIGHSERRQFFGETDQTVAERTTAAQKHGLTPIVCIGETLAEREAGTTLAVVERQLRAFIDLIAADSRPVAIAYEPVWAIGTGKTATPELAAESHAVIRREASEIFGEEFAAKLRILYGGSVKPDNVSELMAQEEIDGALVGGASLDPKSFAAIVKY